MASCNAIHVYIKILIYGIVGQIKSKLDLISYQLMFNHRIYRVKGRIQICGFLRVSTFTDYGLFQFRLGKGVWVPCRVRKLAPQGLEIGGKLQWKYEGNPPLRILPLIQFIFCEIHFIWLITSLHTNRHTSPSNKHYMGFKGTSWVKSF